MPDHEYSCLAVLDVDRTHDYVFHPPRLRLIRGGSALLDDFVAGLPRRSPQGLLYNIKKTRYRVIYSNGGAAQIVFKDRQEAEKFVAAAEWSLKAQSHTAGITGHVENWLAGDSFRQCQQKALKALHVKKRGCRESLSAAGTLYAKPCEECGTEPAATPVTDTGGRKLICLSCQVKAQQRRGNRLVRYVQRKEGGNFHQWPREFTDIAAVSRPAGSIGILYADVNRMGDRQRRLLLGDNDIELPDDESMKRITRFSGMVENVLFNSAHEAVTKSVPVAMGNDNVFPVEFSLAGGDDLIVAVPAHCAVRIAIDLCRNIEEKSTDRTPGVDKLTVSVGVVLAKGNFPIAAMLEMARQLLKSAKKKSWSVFKDTGEDLSAVDFQLLDSGVKDLEEIRGEELNNWRERPHTLSGMERLLQDAIQLKKAGLPLGRLKSLHQSLLQGLAQAQLDYCLMLTRVSPVQRGFLLENFPPQEDRIFRVLPELLEIYDFIEAKRREE